MIFFDILPTVDLQLIFEISVTYQPQEVAGERLRLRLLISSWWRLRDELLIDIPIRNAENAKTQQINKL